MNKLTIISLKKYPIKIRSTILDDEREFHLIIDEEKKEIFHDCPSFLIHSNKDDKVCVHIIKLLIFPFLPVVGPKISFGVEGGSSD